MRTTTFEESMYHLSHSKTMFLRLLEIVRGIDRKKVEEFRAHRQYEQLEMMILNELMGRSGARVARDRRPIPRHEAPVDRIQRG